VLPKRFQKVEIPVGAPSMSDGARLEFENRINIHLHPPCRAAAQHPAAQHCGKLVKESDRAGRRIAGAPPRRREQSG